MGNISQRIIDNKSNIIVLIAVALTPLVFVIAGQVPCYAYLIFLGVILFIIILLLFSYSFSKLLKEFLKKIIHIMRIFWHPYARIIFFILLIIVISLTFVNSYYYLLSFIILILYLVQLNSVKIELWDFQDKFKNLKKWNIITGRPKIEKDFGKPQPDVLLEKDRSHRTNSLISLRKFKSIKDGIIECDVYLEPGSLVNIVVRANFSKEQYYMARLDSRKGCYNSILRLDSGTGGNWQEIARGAQGTIPKTWHKMKVVFKEDIIELYSENNLETRVSDNTYPKGEVGIFNEVENVHADNFRFKKL